ncbi:MAG: NAD-dependent epimerase/dehydratase family protein [Candidatus Vogelbacteria bacterium]|nr:NAD-dependent epimerase/dehydratase family protein [Candidatus Vogelbacteria bacterium]
MKQTLQKPTRLLVIGGNGFIGKYIVEHAVELGWHVTSLSLKPSNQKESPHIRSLAADITHVSLLKAVLKDPSFEYVVNCGGYIDHTLFFKDGRSIVDAHFGGVLNLVEILDRKTLQSFVNIGSSDEYGDAPAPQIETRREMPISPYSLGKVAATHFLQMLYRTEHFPSTTLRLFLTYGPGQDNRRFIPQIIRGCLKNQSFPSSEGKQFRDFCFVQDTVDAVFATFRSPKARGEVINIGSGQPVSIRQMVEAITRLIGKGNPQFGEIAYRPGENMSLYADISKATTLLGWAPKVPLQIGLDKTIQWIKNQL